MQHFVDQKILGLFVQAEESNYEELYAQYSQQVLAIIMSALSNYLQEKSIPKERVDQYTNDFLGALGATNANAQQSVNSLGLIADGLDIKYQDINLLVNSPEFTVIAEESIGEFNQQIYDDARPNLSEDQRAKINEYIASIETEGNDFNNYLTRTFKELQQDGESYLKSTTPAIPVASETLPVVTATEPVPIATTTAPLPPTEPTVLPQFNTPVKPIASYP